MCSYVSVYALVCDVETAVLLDLCFYTYIYISSSNIMISSPLFGDTSTSRARQIDTLKIFNDNVTCIEEDAKYMIDFVTGENKLAMLVILNPDFPKDKPLLKITPPIIHNWVNDNSEVINAPGYLNFTPYSDLGRVVQVIIREFQKSPPELRHNSSPIYNGISARNSPINNLDTKPSCSSAEPYEDMSYITARLHKMSTEELNKLRNDERFFSDFIQSLPSIRNLSETVDDLILSTEELASTKSECETRVAEFEAEIKNQKNHLKDVQCSYKTVLEAYEKLMEKRSNQYIKKKLKETINIVDKDGEIVAERFLDGSLTFDMFLSLYMDYRSRVHLLQAKEKELSSGSGMVKVRFPDNSP